MWYKYYLFLHLYSTSNSIIVTRLVSSTTSPIVARLIGSCIQGLSPILRSNFFYLTVHNPPPISLFSCISHEIFYHRPSGWTCSLSSWWRSPLRRASSRSRIYRSLQSGIHSRLHYPGAMACHDHSSICSLQGYHPGR